MTRLLLLLVLLQAAGCGLPLTARVAPTRVPATQPAAPFRGAPQTVSAQTGMANATVGAVTGLQSEGDVAGIAVQQVVPWGVVGLLVLVFWSMMRLMRYVVRLSHERELKRIEQRGRGNGF